MNFLICCALVSAICVLWLLAIGLYKKTFIDTTVNVQCGSGDQEVMSFTTNFAKDESESSKQAKLDTLWDRIQFRRDQNHEKWLKVKAAAFEKNQQEKPEDLKMLSLAEKRASQAEKDSNAEVS